MMSGFFGIRFSVFKHKKGALHFATPPSLDYLFSTTSKKILILNSRFFKFVYINE